MPPKDPTNAQISSRLSYSQNTPAFLQKFQNRVAGLPDEPEDDEYDDGEFYDDGSGRPPIPQRPAIPERPEDDPGSADEDDGDERPQIVVLREGKHLSAHQAENEKRKERGLPPLPDPKEPKAADEAASSSKNASTLKTKTPAQSLSFSSSKAGTKASKGKRKAIGDIEEDANGGAKSVKGSKKKAKKVEKTLLSFGDDDG